MVIPTIGIEKSIVSNLSKGWKASQKEGKYRSPHRWIHPAFNLQEREEGE